jgi:EpsI family protein
VVLGLGALLVVGIDTQRSVELQRELVEVFPDSVGGWGGREITMTDLEVEVSGVSEYHLRFYEAPGTAAENSWISLYVGYYDRQVGGRSIHSPKNCLPGAGWAPLQSTVIILETSTGPAKVNRYLLQNQDRLALVLYWYQGRGRVQANEYLVKWDLLRDAALRKRSDEALVRIVVPITDGEESAFLLASRAAAEFIPRLATALPS